MTKERTTAQNAPAEPSKTIPTVTPVVPAAEPRTLATADLKGEAKSKATGTATFSGTDTALTKVMIDVKDAPAGTYAVHVFDGKDCSAVKSLETPFKGAPGTAGEGKVGTLGPNTTMEAWQSLGTLVVDNSGTGKAEVPLTNARNAKLDQRIVVIYPEKAAATGEKQEIIACGPVSVSAKINEPAG
jgi:Cu/Zn superoxide dismutase